MLLPEFHVEQVECNQLIFKDITPKYSPKSVGGYGGLNVFAEEIVKTKISLDFGFNGYYIFERNFNQLSGEWAINAYDIPYVKKTSDCSDCGVPCGCEGCSDITGLSPDCTGFMTGFPEGCISIKYEVYSAGINPDELILEGSKYNRIISTCYKDKKIIEIADKLTLGNESQYSFQNTEEKRREKMQSLILAWTKLQILSSGNQNCDCECVASSIKQIGIELNSIEK